MCRELFDRRQSPTRHYHLTRRQRDACAYYMSNAFALSSRVSAAAAGAARGRALQVGQHPSPTTAQCRRVSRRSRRTLTHLFALAGSLCEETRGGLPRRARHSRHQGWRQGERPATLEPLQYSHSHCLFFVFLPRCGGTLNLFPSCTPQLPEAALQYFDTEGTLQTAGPYANPRVSFPAQLKPSQLR